MAANDLCDGHRRSSVDQLKVLWAELEELPLDSGPKVEPRASSQLALRAYWTLSASSHCKDKTQAQVCVPHGASFSCLRPISGPKLARSQVFCQSHDRNAGDCCKSDQHSAVAYESEILRLSIYVLPPRSSLQGAAQVAL